jgi:hypothetical protein
MQQIEVKVKKERILTDSLIGETVKEDNPKKPTCKTQAALALSMELFVRQRPWLPSSIGPVLLLPMDFLLSLPPSSVFSVSTTL